jgi:hypothetical protein
VSRRSGRPRADRLALVEKVAALLLADPTLSANAVAAAVRARRAEALRAVRAIRPFLSDPLGPGKP